MTVFDWNAPRTDNGPIYGGQCEDLDFTMLQWRTGEGVAEHANDEVDVLMIVFSGSGEVILEGITLVLAAGKAAVIPKGVRRRIVSTSDDFRYLNVHKRRRRMMPNMTRTQMPSQ